MYAAGGSRGMREVVTASLESDDLAALVRLAFERGAAAAAAEGDSSADPSQDVEPGGGLLDAVVQELHEAAARKEAEIRRACDANAADIAAALREAGPLQQSAAELRRQVQDKSSSLQRLGGAFAGKVEELEAAELVTGRVAEARAAAALAAAVLSQCEEVVQCLAAQQLYRAHRLLAGLQLSYADALRSARDAAEAAAQAGGAAQPVRPQPVAAARAADASVPQLGQLADALLGMMVRLERDVEERAVAELNAWLVEARAAARGIGEVAMAAAAAEHGRQEQLAAARAASVCQLQAAGRAAAATAAAAQLAQLASSGAGPGGGDALSTLCSLDMTPLLRCVHVFSASARLPVLLERYTSSRQAQLGADLASQGDVLGSHAAYLAQLAGYFLVEDRVAAAAPAVGTDAHAEAAWEGAAAAVGAVLGAAIDECGSRAAMLAVARSVALACAALDAAGRAGFPTEGIRRAMAARAGRFRAALAEGLRRGIQAAGGDAESMAQVVGGVAADCSVYLSCWVPPGELAAAVRRDCELLVSSALAANTAAASVSAAGGESGDGAADALGPALQLVSSAAAVASALALPPSGGRDAQQQQLRGILLATEEAAGRLVAAAAAPAVAQCAALDWMPSRMLRTGGACSPQFERLVAVLAAQQERVAGAALPLDSQRRIMSTALRGVGQALMALLASDAVPAFTVFGMQRLLSELASLARFAELAAGDAAALAEPVAFCELVAFDRVGALLSPGGREECAALDASRCAALLMKLRDPAGGDGASAGERQSGHRLLTRQAAAAAAAQLRKAEGSAGEAT